MVTRDKTCMIFLAGDVFVECILLCFQKPPFNSWHMEVNQKTSVGPNKMERRSGYGRGNAIDAFGAGPVDLVNLGLGLCLAVNCLSIDM